jgi:glycosyltransferase involved in cell wall biosynthesis
VINSMKNSRNIYYCGRGAVKEDGVLYVKQSDYDYWSECSKYYTNINLFIYISPYLKTKNEYSFSLENFNGNVFSYNILSTFRKIRSIASITFKMARSPRNSIFFFYFPNSVNIVLYILAKIMGKKTVTYWGNDWELVGAVLSKQVPGVSKFRPHIYGFAQRSIIKLSNLVIFAGKHTSNKYQKYASQSIDTRPFISIKKEDVFYREDTCLGDVINILYVGTFTERKGIWDLLDIFKILNDEKNIKLTLVGCGKLNGEIIKKIKLYNLQDKIEMAGYIGDINELKSCYQKSDIFVLPSYIEGFPRVLYESMSQCLPIVSTDVGGIPHLLVNNENALLCKAGDIECMVRKLLKLIELPSLRKKMIKNNVKLFEEIASDSPGKQHSLAIRRIFHVK